MKIKKAITIILLVMLFIAQFSFISTVRAVDGSTNERRIEVTLRQANEDIELIPGQTFEMIAHVDNFQNVEKPMYYVQAQLEIDKNILEYVGIAGQNGWELKANSFNETNGKFIVETDTPTGSALDIFKISFKIKSDIAEEVTTAIKLKGIQASGGDGLIRSNDATAQISVEIPEEPELPEKITSSKYEIANGMIARIIPGTTVKEFMKHVQTENVADDGIVFIDKAGNTLSENSIIATGMTIKVGETLQFTASVIGDVDGDGQITVNDLAKVKLHYIADTLLTKAYLKAADVDGKMEDNSAVGVNDMAQIKLVLINLMEIK